MQTQDTPFYGSDSHSGATSSSASGSIAESQQIIFNYFLEIVKNCSPEYVLSEFERIFFQFNESSSFDASAALGLILLSGNEQEFKNTLKRSCYILINNWDIARQFDLIQSLVNTVLLSSRQRSGVAPASKRLGQWLGRFISGPDYQELKLFANRFSEVRTVHESKEWVAPYTSYLLVHQYVNFQNSFEQRDAARKLAQRLKDQFKFDLARYTVLSQTGIGARSPQNPTALGDGALRLIKAIVASRGNFSYKNLARLFLEQVDNTSYARFKQGLSKYLLFAIKDKATTERLNSELSSYLADLYPEYDFESVNRGLILRTCNRVIDYFLIDSQKQPSPLFVMLLTQGNSLTLAIVLLKITLISRDSLLYLEGRIADLLRHYEQLPKDQCDWIINFLEVFRVAFTINADNVEYSLVTMGNRRGGSSQPLPTDSETVRIYSQIRSF